MAKYEVCPRCRGEGYVSKLGSFTSADLDEAYGDGPEREEFIEDYMRRGGPYDEHCPACKGNRVITKEELEAYEEREADRITMLRESGVWT